MNANHIRVINRALNGQDIYGLPSFKSQVISNIQIDLIKQDLIKLGILSGFTSFTNEGGILGKRIKEYKEAKVYIHLNHMIIGPINKDRAILLKKSDDLYSFTTINIKDIVDQIGQLYKFTIIDHVNKIDNSSCKFSVNDEKLSISQVFVKYKLKVDTSFYIKCVNSQGQVLSNELFFDYQGYKYIYTSTNGMLRQVSLNELQEKLVERLGVYG